MLPLLRGILTLRIHRTDQPAPFQGEFLRMTRGDFPESGPRGGTTTITPSGLQKTSVYLRPDQIHRLKLTGLERRKTMSILLRRAIDHYFGLRKEDCRLSEYQREVAEMILRDRFGMEDGKVAEFLATFERVSNIDDDV